MKSFDIVIVGAGIVGLAAAQQLRRTHSNLKIAVLDKELGVARHQTGHNSGVIHSGVYYKPGSQKALNCQRGYQLMLQFLEDNEIEFDICGKLIVATDAEEAAYLEILRKRGEANGLHELEILNSEEAKEYEPYVNAHSALHVPQAGIVDYKEVAQKLFLNLMNHGVEFFLGERVVDIRESYGCVRVITESNVIEADLLVNCAGLYSDIMTELVTEEESFKIIPFRGEYYDLKPESEKYVKNLIYPVPDPRFPFLGVHFTRKMGGGVEAGPNAVLALAREGYTWGDINLGELLETFTWMGFYRVAYKYWNVGFEEMRRSLSKARFTQSLQKLIPEIQEGDLVKAGAGVRAQACSRTGGLVDDFMIKNSRRSIHVCNAPSPAATSSLAIGETVASLTEERI